jgi:hypothetical protein
VPKVDYLDYRLGIGEASICASGVMGIEGKSVNIMRVPGRSVSKNEYCTTVVQRDFIRHRGA